METKHTDGKTFLVPPIVPPNLNVKPLSYPKEQIEHLVDQIIKLHEKGEYLMYSHHIDTTINILNNMLDLYTRYILIVKDGK